MKKTSTLLILAVASVLTTGCVKTAPKTEFESEARVPLTCASKQQCDTYWQRATIWVSKKSTVSIRFANESVIETHGAGVLNQEMRFRISRIPTGENGAGRIGIDSFCGALGCREDVFEKVVDFKRFVRTGY